MEDNPYNYQGQAERDYKLFTICLLPHLNYLDYNYITDENRKKAEAKLGETVQEIDREGANEQKQSEVEREPNAVHVKAHIDLTDDMMKKIHAGSEANKEFDVLKADDIWGTLEEKLEEPTQKFQGQMKMLYSQRVNDIAYCERELKKAAARAEKDCIQEIKKYQSYRKKMRREIESKVENERGDEEEYGQTLLDELEKLESRLMHIEMSLQQKLNEGTDVFNDRVQSNYK